MEVDQYENYSDVRLNVKKLSYYWHLHPFKKLKNFSLSTYFRDENLPLHCVWKTTQLWNGLARNYKDRFWWY